MRRVVGQAGILLVSIFLSISPSPSAAGRWDAQLRAECQELIDLAIRRPYGWAWGEVPDVPGSRPTPREVNLDALATPAAALVLHLAGKQMQDPKLLEAARQAARGLAATIEKSGRVPLRAVFGASANSKPEPAAVPDRAPSCAAVAVWATLLRDSGTQRDDQLTRSLGRTIAWLTKQQAPSGAWFEAYPPDAPPGKADRIVRLDLPGYRDATLALLLATQTVDNKVASAHAQKSIDLLLKLRIDPQTKSIGGLWRAAALPDGEPAKQVRPLPAEAFSALATRHAMHTLLAAYFLGGKKEVGLALDLATKQIDPLQRDDGLWDAFYDSSGQAVSATQPAGQSRDEPAPVDAIWARSTFGLDELIRTTRIVRVLGKEKFVAMLEAGLPLNDNIAMLLCGLTETVGTASLPVSADEVDNFIEKNASLWTLLEGPPPPDIQGKVRRLGVLQLRDRVERTRN